MEGSGLSLRVLGPVEVWVGGVLVPARRAKVRALLGFLALHVNRAVGDDRLVAALWDDPPSSARANLRNYLSELRRLLDGEPGGIEPARLVGVTGGVSLCLPDDALDVVQFREQMRRARQCVAWGEHAAAGAHYRRALGVWRGSVAQGVPRGAVLDREFGRVEDSRLDAVEELAQIRLELGEHQAVVEDLREVLAGHPYRERACAVVMMALYRSGNPAAALQEYRLMRDRLGEDLGIVPTPRLQALQTAILRHDTAVLLAPPASDSPDRPAPAESTVRGGSTLWQVPPVPAPFVGRDRQMAAVAAALAGSEQPGRSPVVLLHGMAGVGKSALAAAVAHEQRSRYPGGCLYVNLNGCDPHRAPVEPVDVLVRLLRALGVNGPPTADVDEATAVLRATLTDRAMLLILDDAAAPEQLRPLLPASPSCAVLVTSRRAMPTLDATPIRVDRLDEAAALALLRGIAGPGRIATDPEAASDATRLCGHLPLALRIIAGRLASHPHWTLRQLATRLAAQQRRLDELHADDLDVRSGFRVSYHALHREPGPVARTAATALCLLGRHDPTDIAIPATAALLGTDPGTAEQALDRLAADHLIDPASGGRYRLHDLLRLFVRELAAAQLTPADWDPALHRLLRHYLDRVIEANHILRIRPTSQTQTSHFVDYRQAQQWMDSERTNIQSAIAAGTTGTDTTQRLALHLARDLAPYLGTWGHWTAVTTTATTALTLAHQLGDHPAIAQAHGDLGAAKLHTNDHTGALAEVRQQLAGYEQLDDQQGICRALNNIAVCARHTGDYPTAFTHLEQALTIRRNLGDRQGEAMALDNLALVYQSLTNYPHAITLHHDALHIARTLPDPLLKAFILINLAQTHQKAGHASQALTYLDQATEAARQCNNTTAQATALDIRSQALTDLGKHQAAHTCQQRATQLRNQLASSTIASLATTPPSA